MALLNSRLIRYAYHVLIRESHQDAFPQVKVKSLRALPLRQVNFADEKEKGFHDKLVQLTDAMLSLQEKREDGGTAEQLRLYERRITSIDSEIDQLVEDLYQLNEAEKRQISEFLSRTED